MRTPSERERQMNAKYALATGNPFDGLKLHGPFDDAETANEYADNHYRSEDWWVMLINPPEKEQRVNRQSKRGGLKQ